MWCEACSEVSSTKSRNVDAKPPGMYLWPLREGERGNGRAGPGEGGSGRRNLGSEGGEEGVCGRVGSRKRGCCDWVDD